MHRQISDQIHRPVLEEWVQMALFLFTRKFLHEYAAEHRKGPFAIHVPVVQILISSILRAGCLSSSEIVCD
jgi:hypothetical protein